MDLILWVVFGLVVVGLLALDLGLFHRKSHEVKMKEALIWSGVWIGLALLFNVGVWLTKGPQAGLEFMTAYLIEKSLSVDNVFVFAVVFGYFAVPAAYQHRVLFWGIIGALVSRAIFIAGGIALLDAFHWTVYLFGAILLVTAIRLFVQKDKELDPSKNAAFRLLRRVMPVSERFHGDAFRVRIDGRWVATPLLAALVVVELTDILFAVDSVPAVLAVSRDPFIVYTSNVFAILGLRALYFALADVIARFHLLHYGLATILAFVALKLLLTGVVAVPIPISLGVIGAILLLSIVGSIVWPRPHDADRSLPPDESGTAGIIDGVPAESGSAQQQRPAEPMEAKAPPKKE